MNDFAIDVLDPTESRDLNEILTGRHRAGMVIVTKSIAPTPARVSKEFAQFFSRTLDVGFVIA